MSDPLNEISIDICVITYKRPTLLLSLLKGLSGLELDSNIKVRLIVVDNDIDESAKKIIQTQDKELDYDVIYDVEPIKNIALARNLCLSHVTADYIAFIDDDESPVPQWLKKLLHCALNYNADVVFGPVLPDLPETSSSWIIEGGFFNRQRFETGTKREDGGSGNILLRSALFKKEKYCFNPEYGITGGSDSELIHRLHKAGKKMLWCDEAIVIEHIEAHRLSEKWIITRGYRCGQGFYHILVAERSKWRRILWYLDTGKEIVICLLQLIISPLKGYSVIILSLRKLANLIGMLSASFGLRHKEYK